MRFFIIFGPPAVGKMTVAKELSSITGFPYFHNHLSIELGLRYFEWGSSSFRRVDNAIRFTIFEEIAKSMYEGFIFTFAWAVDLEDDLLYLKRVKEVFSGSEIYHIELECNLDERLRRNSLPDRLAAKPSKQDVKFSEELLLEHDSKYRFNTKEGEYDLKNYLRIDSTLLTAREVAEQIVKHFELTDKYGISTGHM